MKPVCRMAAAAFVVSSFGALDVHADSSGSASMASCDGCHRGGAAPTVRFLVNGAAATSARLARGQTVTLGFAVTPPGASQGRAGFKVSSPFPLSPDGAGVKAVSPNVVTHASPGNAGGGRVVFAFRVTIPASEACSAIRTLTGWGTAANGDGTRNGDGNASATLAVTVDCPPPHVPSVAPPGPAPASGPTVSMPRLSEGDAAQVLWGWLQTSNHYRMPTRHFATRNARLVERDWTFELVLACCAQGELVDVWRVDSATKLVSRQTAPGVFVRP